MKGRLIASALATAPMLAIAVAAQAADVAVPVHKVAPPAQPTVSTNWSGLYLGAHAGAGWGSTNADFHDSLLALRWVSGVPINGALAGGQIGYNWQSGWFVYGLEADGSWSNITGHGLCNTTAFFMNCNSTVQGLATFTGRLGATVERTLIYLKGGAAWAHDSESISNVAQAPFVGAFTSNVGANRWGWTLGMGVEYAFLPNWSAKLEYDFIDFGSQTYNFPVTNTAVGATNFANWSYTVMVHEMKMGVNYHF